MLQLDGKNAGHARILMGAFHLVARDERFP